MKRLSLIILFLSVLVIGKVQSQCGSLPMDSLEAVQQRHYGNGNFLIEVENIIHNYRRRHRSNLRTDSDFKGESEGIFKVPIQVWAFKDSDNSRPSITEQALNILLERVNAEFRKNHTGISFYLYGSTSFSSNSNFNKAEVVENSDNRYADIHETMNSNRFEPDKIINWYIVRELVGTGGIALSYKGGGPVAILTGNYMSQIKDWNSPNETVLQKTVNVIVHELGHRLGLPHTHNPGRMKITGYNGDINGFNGNIPASYAQFQEYRDRNKKVKVTIRNFNHPYVKGKTYNVNQYALSCEVNGDYLCDTDASPRSLGTGLNCVYTGTDHDGDRNTPRIMEKDLDNQQFTPQTDNYMAYVNSSCRSSFTKGQISVMISRIMDRLWYNRNYVLTGGTVWNNEVDNVRSSQHIVTKSTGLTVHGNLKLTAQESIRLKSGTSIKDGAIFRGKVSPISRFFIDHGYDFIGSGNRQSEEKTQFTSDVYRDDLEGEYFRLLERMDREKALIYHELSDEGSDRLQSVWVAPNPAVHQLSVDYYLEESSWVTFKLNDINGRVVYEKNIYIQNDHATEYLDVSSFERGTYFLRLISNEFDIVKKVILQ